MPTNGREVLVVGGCGYVGHLIAPWLMVMYDGPLYNFEPKVCDPCPWRNRIIGDVTDLGQVFLAAQNKGAILFLPMGKFDDPQSLFEVGVRGWYNCLLVAKALRTPRVVLISSLSVYDDWQTANLESEDRPPICDAPYNVVKVLEEDLGRHFARCYGMSVLALRIAQPKAEASAIVGRRGDVPYATSDRKLAEAVVAALSLKGHVGFDAIHVTENKNPNAINQEKAKRLLGWEP